MRTDRGTVACRAFRGATGPFRPRGNGRRGGRRLRLVVLELFHVARAHGIYLEDLYVQPAHRGNGLGRALLRELARECQRRGFERLEWAVLDWNQPAINFYRSIGAQAQDEWTIFRLTDEQLFALTQT